MYQHYDNNNENISLHDCKAEKAVFEKGVLSFFFPDGFWIGQEHEANATGNTVRTDASKVSFKLEFGEEEDVTVYVFTDKKHDRALRKRWKLDKLIKKINSGSCQLEFLYQYKGYRTQVIECQLWCKKKPYHRECVLIISLDNITYCWNSLVKERTW